MRFCVPRWEFSISNAEARKGQLSQHGREWYCCIHNYRVFHSCRKWDTRIWNDYDGKTLITPCSGDVIRQDFFEKSGHDSAASKSCCKYHKAVFFMRFKKRLPWDSRWLCNGFVAESAASPVEVMFPRTLKKYCFHRGVAAEMVAR